MKAGGAGATSASGRPQKKKLHVVNNDEAVLSLQD